MLESDLSLKLEALKRELEWKFWKVGRYADGIVYLEFETKYQYDEYQFMSRYELNTFVQKYYQGFKTSSL